MYFAGDAPSVGSNPFSNTPNVIVYYSVGAVGWTSSFGGRPAFPWDATISSLSVTQATGASLTITGSAGLSFVVQRSFGLENPSWTPFCTNRTSTAPFHTNDVQGASRAFYRLRSP
jgi:hypothetical protein